MTATRPSDPESAQHIAHGNSFETSEASRPFLQVQNDNATGTGTARMHKASSAELTLFNCLAIILGLQIGSGIFLAPARILSLVPAPGFAILVWLLAGLFVWTGAASFCELALAVPVNGGIQEYLRCCYGDFPAFLFTSTWVLLTKPAAMAMIAIVFSDHLCRTVFQTEAVPLWINKFVALSGLTIITIVNCAGMKTGATVANVFLALKLGAVFSIGLIGLSLIWKGEAAAMQEPGFHWFYKPKTIPGKTQDAHIWTLFGDAVSAFYAALFCFAGWESIGFVTGEMRNAARDLPIAMNLAMIIVIVGFTMANVSFYAVVPLQVMKRKETVAAEFGEAVFGHTASIAYSLIISISALGAMNVNVFATGRLCVAASKRGYFPSILANIHYDRSTQEVDYYHQRLGFLPSFVVEPIACFAAWTADLRLEQGVPIYAMIMNTLLSFIYTVFGSFAGLTTFVGISEYIFFLLAVCGLRRIRTSSSKVQERVYQTYNLNPIMFCTVSAILILRGILQHVWQGIFIILLVSTEWLSYRYFIQ